MSFNMAAVKAQFFTTAVTAKITPAAGKFLSRKGAFIRQRAKTSIRKRKKPSPPGRPPSSHAGTLKRFIFFGLEPGGRSLVVGPTLAGPATGAPAALEHGGPAVVREKVGGVVRKREVQIRPRPYMTPALEAESGPPTEFKDLVR